MLGIVLKMTRRTHGSQVLWPAVALIVIAMSNGQCASMSIEWFTRAAALLTALLTLPVGFNFNLECDLRPVVRIF